MTISEKKIRGTDHEGDNVSDCRAWIQSATIRLRIDRKKLMHDMMPNLFILALLFIFILMYDYALRQLGY